MTTRQLNSCAASAGSGWGRWIVMTLLVAGLGWGPSPAALAQETPPAEAEQEEQPPAEEPEAEEEEDEGFQEQITVTGTRFEGRSAVDTPSPVDIIDAASIERIGTAETGKILQRLAPSVNFSTTFISDGTDAIRPLTLRSLSADEALVLINGKRRHSTAHVNVQQTVARGESGVDINSIPAGAIERIEVLRDGAAAQYGSDAIGGVINIILKEQTGATDVGLDLGSTYEGDGDLVRGSVNSGWSIGDGGFFNLTAEYRDRSETNRAGLATTNALGWYASDSFTPEVKLRIGDSDAQDALLWLNAGIPVGDGQFYAFGGYSERESNSSGFFRGPGDNRTVPALYPDGFLPTIITEPTDTSLVFGYRGQVGDGWTYDASANWGMSEFAFREENTVNVTYWFEPLNPNNPTGPRFFESPTKADTGTLQHDQLSLNLDFTRPVDWGLGAGPLFVAVGAEYREEGYEIEPGDPVSYQYGRTNDRSIPIFGQAGEIGQPGTQGFPGWSPTEAVDGDRDNISAYVDFESRLSEKFQTGLALRFEDYSDFGSTVTGKLSGRQDFTDRFALRGTVSTGFHAPGVQQIFFSQRSTNLNAQGVLTDTLTARQGSAVTDAFGVPPLEEETSVNYSVGVVARPNPNFRITADLFRVEIDDRIVFSSNIQPEGSCAPDLSDCPIRAILDPIGVGQVLFFTNAVDTQTDGLDVVVTYDWRFRDESLLALEGAFHLNDTEVTARRSTSPILPPGVLFDQAQVTLVEEGQPGEHYVLGGTYYLGPLATTLRFNYYGSVAGEGFTGVKQEWGGKWLTDLAVQYRLRDNLSLTLGGDNIFDQFPDRWSTDAASFGIPGLDDGFGDLGLIYGWETLPFGINGGSYYARLSYSFQH